MRIASLDCFAGIAGDMFLGALIDAGVPAQVLHAATAALGLDATLRIETVNRSGISCTKVHVLSAGKLAEATPTQPEHKHGHPHDHPHEHPHVHGRSLSVIRTLIQAASLPEPVKLTALRAFDLLGHSEAKIHNVPVEEIHFHEVGAVDAIVDIVASAAGIHHLQIDQWFCSPLNVGSGTVVCAHGTFPVPAPATADLLRGLPTYSAHVQMELVTPTGAAIIRALAPSFAARPVMLVDRIGYGAGTRNTPGFPNVLSLSIGESSATAIPQPPTYENEQPVTVLETALDDLSPQILAHVAETALATGALDVMLTPVIMKKGRPGTLLTILCNESERAALQQLIFRETSTIGVRIRHDRRICLDRTLTTVQTPYGPIRIKVATLAGEELNAAPEFEDCRAAAQQHNVAVKLVQQAALTAFRAQA
ncbi:MAG: nickel pincer cofactor biosynthesis protein LarC [Acidobacteriaceae bacterium]|nr:nickel pincer cofactor biosynthesis protein LarC [Acidobacteriaceae bacterium]